MKTCFLLLPGHSNLSLVLARETLRTANECLGAETFTWECRTSTGDPVRSSDGNRVAPDKNGWQGAGAFDLILLCTGSEPVQHLPLGMRSFLLQAQQAGVTLDGLDQGVGLLASLGLPIGPSIAKMDSILSPGTVRLPTGMAVVDMMLGWVDQTQGRALAMQVAQAMGHSPDTPSEPPQTMDPVLTRMQAIMMANLEKGLPLTKIAASLGLSLKQLRRRCVCATGQTPGQLYQIARLERAEQLVQNTELPVSDIAKAAGFASPSAFTRAYRLHFETTPRASRAARRQVWAA
jgi:AraC family carnitine catabolism transcriptional activator